MKQLHKHIIPIVVMSVGLFIASIIGFEKLALPNSNSNSILGTLVSGRVIKVTAGKNGLAHIEFYHAPTQSSTAALKVTPVTAPQTGLGQLSTVGGSAQLEMTVNLAAEASQN